MIEVQDLCVGYQVNTGFRPVLSDVSFSVGENMFIPIVGPSGCGKTTLLRCLSGLIMPHDGTVTMNGEPVTKPPEGLTVVFQDYSRSLMSWMSVRSNIELPHRGRGMKRAERRSLARDALSMVGLGDAEDLFPWQLSGGMQQRVAIARALACHPQVLIMDEPFASVDAQTRMELEDLVRRIQHELGVTIILVTHDIDEAVYMGERIVVLGGRPASVVAELDVPLPRERDQIATKGMPAFIDVRADVLTYLKGPVGSGTDRREPRVVAAGA